MPVIDLSLDGKRYSLSCEEGQEEHLKKINQRLEIRYKKLKNSLGNKNENMMLFILALMLEDEILGRKSEGASSELDKEKISNISQKLEKIIAKVEDL